MGMEIWMKGVALGRIVEDGVIGLEGGRAGYWYGVGMGMGMAALDSAVRGERLMDSVGEGARIAMRSWRLGLGQGFTISSCI